ncbi:MAG TPA: SPASM domain-containing protein [Anaerolineales bacterium]|nr:SPASM domain-containing protein [Anaerolineales bacterium]
MELQNTLRAIVDENGRLILPPETIASLGLVPGAEILLENTASGTTLRRAANHLAKVYIEPTSRCNLNCDICIRNSWTVTQGDMAGETFKCLSDSLRHFEYKPVISFGGFGEPLLHPDIIEMIAQAKEMAQRVEVITNGLLLTEQMVRDFIHLGLDVLWFSVDSPRASANDGSSNLFSKIEMMDSLRRSLNSRRPETGFVFVATSSNVNQFPLLVRSANRYGVSRYMVTNVLPYSADMCNQMLCTRVLDEVESRPSPWLPLIQLPRIDWNEHTLTPLHQTLHAHHNIRIHEASLDMPAGRCPFIETGVVAVSSDGAVSPCLALMHSHVSYLQEKPRTVSRYVIGNINDMTLTEIWNDPNHLSFRKRVQEFNFPPCTSCGGCDMVAANQEDCFGNAFPTCGGCLWAWGVIQCP